MWSYNPMSEEEAEKHRGYKLCEPGIYEFRVDKATPRQSSSGNPMIELELTVFADDGGEYKVFDYLVATDKMQWKIRHFCDALRMTDAYEQGKFQPNMCVNKHGFADIIYQAGKPKNDGSGAMYKDKNAVEDYFLDKKGNKKVRTENVSSKQGKQAEPMPDLPDDDIPF